MQIDYEARPAFVVDASVFPGSSGSPVLVLPEPVRLMADGGVEIRVRKNDVWVLSA